MKKICLIISLLFLFSCAKESDDFKTVFNPSLVDAAKTICPKYSTYSLPGFYARIPMDKYIQFSLPGSSQNMINEGKRNDDISFENYEKCSDIIDSIVPGYNVNTDFVFIFNENEIYSEYQKMKGQTVKAKPFSAFLNLLELSGPRTKLRPIVRQHSFPLILKCPNDFDLTCAESKKPNKCEYFTLSTPKEPCVFAVDKQHITTKKGSKFLFSLEGTISTRTEKNEYNNDSINVEIKHLSFD